MPESESSSFSAWTPAMRAYCAALVVKGIAEGASETPEDAEMWDQHVFETGRQLSVKMRREAEAYAQALMVAHHDTIRERVVREYDDEDHDWDSPWRRQERISYDPAIYALWMAAVRSRGALKIIYDSDTSGRTERIVEPLRTQTPYGIAYCRLRQEERKFRFDRIAQAEICGKRTYEPDS